MARYLTRTINMARFLARKYFQSGRAPFRQELSIMVRFLADQFSDRAAELTTHLDTLMDSLVHDFSDNDSDRIVRRKALLSGAWRSAATPSDRAEAFLRELDTLLDAMEAEMDTEALGPRVVQLIKECSEEELRMMTLEALADRFHYSRTHFAERFGRERGITVHDALTHEKMHRAFHLLSEEEPPPTIRELTRRLGFSDPVYFSRVFRKIYGMLPSRLRGE